MFRIDRLSAKPVYEQIVEQFEEMILGGVLTEGDQLPSVRTLAVEITVNPNTLQKAYGELERRGLTIAASGSGRFIAPGALGILKEGRMARLDAFMNVVEDLARAGIPKERLAQGIEDVYRKQNKPSGDQEG